MRRSNRKTGKQNWLIKLAYNFRKIKFYLWLNLVWIKILTLNAPPTARLRELGVPLRSHALLQQLCWDAQKAQEHSPASNSFDNSLGEENLCMQCNLLGWTSVEARRPIWAHLRALPQSKKQSHLQQRSKAGRYVLISLPRNSCAGRGPLPGQRDTPCIEPWESRDERPVKSRPGSIQFSQLFPAQCFRILNNSRKW